MLPNYISSLLYSKWESVLISMVKSYYIGSIVSVSLQVTVNIQTAKYRTRPFHVLSQHKTYHLLNTQYSLPLEVVWYWHTSNAIDNHHTEQLKEIQVFHINIKLCSSQCCYPDLAVWFYSILFLINLYGHYFSCKKLVYFILSFYKHSIILPSAQLYTLHLSIIS